MNYDFSGYVTKNDIRCSDGRVIKKDAFLHNDGQTVPLVWQHLHDSPTNVVGHVLLENRPDGVYGWGSLNDTEQGIASKSLIRHGDVDSLSINANRLKQNGPDVYHGNIKEVSLVLKGANPGAKIENIYFEHSEEGEEEGEAIIFLGGEVMENSEYIKHADKAATSDSGDATVGDIYDAMTDDQKQVVEFLIDQAVNDAVGDEASHADDEEEKPADGGSNGDATVGDIYDAMTEDQKKVVMFLIEQAVKEATGGEASQADYEEDEYYDLEGGKEMKHNVFSDGDVANNELMHAEGLETILQDGKKFGSLKESFLAHADAYGIKNIDYLFPDAKNLNNTPDFIQRDTSWVSTFMNGTTHTPFSRIKFLHADITQDEARARGYVKGKQKVEEVITLLKRTTSPQTIYKKQKLDRDDIIDITDFDVVAWIKTEMRQMLDEEIARAGLIGDGRSPASDDKISEEHVRPIVSDNDLYSIKYPVIVDDDTDSAEVAKKTITAAVKSRKDYKGSGNPVFYTTEDILTSMLLLEDNIGRKLYKDQNELATALRVSNIVTVPVMENYVRKDSQGQPVVGPLIGIIVNPKDYTFGADKGGSINMFDDFDIDYNQQKYLMETRCSGALTIPFSAIVLEVTKNINAKESSTNAKDYYPTNS